MAEYIERKKLEEAFDNADLDVCESDSDGYSKWGFGRENVRDVIRSVPTSDVAPVVRCKNCKYLVSAMVNANGFLICNISDMEIAPEDFCSYGEPKEG